VAAFSYEHGGSQRSPSLRMGFLPLHEIIFCFLGLRDFFYIFFAVSALIYLGYNLGKRWIFVYLYGLHPYVASFIM
jgi:hypothetical protein